MAIVQEQAIEWLAGLKAMQDNPAFFEAACAFVPTIPLNPDRLCFQRRNQYVVP